MQIPAAGGLGMEIDDYANVVSCRPQTISSQAGVPVPSQLVAIDGTTIQSKADVVEIVTAKRGGSKSFLFKSIARQPVAFQNQILA